MASDFNEMFETISNRNAYIGTLFLKCEIIT